MHIVFWAMLWNLIFRRIGGAASMMRYMSRIQFPDRYVLRMKQKLKADGATRHSSVSNTVSTEIVCKTFGDISKLLGDHWRHQPPKIAARGLFVTPKSARFAYHLLPPLVLISSCRPQGVVNGRAWDARQWLRANYCRASVDLSDGEVTLPYGWSDCKAVVKYMGAQSEFTVALLELELHLAVFGTVSDTLTAEVKAAWLVQRSALTDQLLATPPDGEAEHLALATMMTDLPLSVVARLLPLRDVPTRDNHLVPDSLILVHFDNGDLDVCKVITLHTDGRDCPLSVQLYKGTGRLRSTHTPWWRSAAKTKAGKHKIEAAMEMPVDALSPHTVDIWPHSVAATDITLTRLGKLPASTIRLYQDYKPTLASC
jgi:hypothetical protein